MSNEIDDFDFSLDDLFKISEKEQEQFDKWVEDTFNDFHINNHLLGDFDLAHKIGFYRNKTLTNFLISLIKYAEQKYLKSKKVFNDRQAFVVDSDVYIKLATRIATLQKDNNISTKLLLANFDLILEQQKFFLNGLDNEISSFESKKDIDILEYFEKDRKASDIRSLIRALELYKQYLIQARYI